MNTFLLFNILYSLLHSIIKLLYVVKHLINKLLFPWYLGAIGAIDEVKPLSVNQLHTVAMIYVIIIGQPFGLPDSFGYNWGKFYALQIIPTIKAWIVTTT